jgi:hypothetical protein
LECIEAYSVTLDSSLLYVPEWQAGMVANPSQLSTVLRGMARNSCGENMKNVRLHFAVHDDAGERGEGFVNIDEIAASEAKPFETAWMSRLTSYEITAGR